MRRPRPIGRRLPIRKRPSSSIWGCRAAATVRDGLIAAGRDPQTPVAVLARGTRPDAKSAVGPLDGLAALAAQAGEGPALLVIGEVVARSRYLARRCNLVTLEFAA